jgi:hypothetical protein
MCSGGRRIADMPLAITWRDASSLVLRIWSIFGLCQYHGAKDRAGPWSIRVGWRALVLRGYPRSEVRLALRSE